MLGFGILPLPAGFDVLRDLRLLAGSSSLLSSDVALLFLLSLCLVAWSEFDGLIGSGVLRALPRRSLRGLFVRDLSSRYLLRGLTEFSLTRDSRSLDLLTCRDPLFLAEFGLSWFLFGERLPARGVPLAESSPLPPRCW